MYALTNPYALDGRSSSHPLDVRGFTTLNSFLLMEDDYALLYGTGFSVHQDILLEQLDELVDGRRLSLAVPRVEWAGMCNARPIAERFDVDTIYQLVPLEPAQFLNFRPDYPGGSKALRRAKLGLLGIGVPLSVSLDADGRRQLELLAPGLRLLPSSWAYDASSRTLFTGDMFSWVWHRSPEGPWLLGDDETVDPTTPERVAHALLRNRYWWLAGAETDDLRRDLAAIFDRYAIDVLAPDHGCILTRSAIERHYRMLDDLLAEAPRLRAVGVEAGSWSTT
jgi:hypothetical protein